MAELRPQNEGAHFQLPLINSIDGKSYLSGATIVAGDIKVAVFIAGGWNINNILTLPTEIGTTGVYRFTLIPSEMNPSDTNYPIAIICKDVTGAEWNDNMKEIYVKPISINMVEINGGATDGNNAVLKLKQLDITTPSGVAFNVNSANDAAFRTYGVEGVHVESSGSGSAFKVSSLSGKGLEIYGGGNIGVQFSGAGIGFDCNGSTGKDISADEIDDILVDTSATLPAQITALNNLSDAEVTTIISDALGSDAISELGVGVPTATPTIKTALMLLYMALRNKGVATAIEKSFHNSSDVVIAKKELSKTGIGSASIYNENEMVSG